MRRPMKQPSRFRVLTIIFQEREYGGFYSYFERYSSDLSSRGVEVYIFTNSLRALPHDKLRRKLHVHPIVTKHKFIFAVRCTFSATLLAIRRRINIIHAFAPITAFFGTLLKVVTGGRTVVSIRSNWWLEYGYKRSSATSCTGRIVYQLYPALGVIALKLSDAVTTVTNEQKTLVAQITTKPIEVIPNVVDISRFNPNVKSDRLRHEYGLIDKHIIMFLGPLDPTKGIECLIRSMKEVTAWKRQVVLVIVGEGPIRQRLKMLVEREVSGNIIFTGYRRDVPECLACADLFVLPSLTEGSSNALLEAMAMAKPIVATNVGGNRDVVLHGVNGILVEPANVQELSLAIIYLLSKPEEAQKLGRNAHQYVLEKRTLFTTQPILDLYSQASRRR